MTLSARSDGIRALAREIAERRFGKPAYLTDEEEWAEALAEAQATYEPPKPLSPLQEAVRKAEGKHLTAEEIEQSIHSLNEVSAALRAAVDAAKGDTE